MAATQIGTSGWTPESFSMPSGAAIRQTSRMSFAPALLQAVDGGDGRVAVASIGSSTSTVRSARSEGALK